MTIPTVDTVDFENPKEHVLPALQFLPAAGGAPTVTHPSITEEWSERIFLAGYAYIPWLIEKYADENGMIRAADLPKPKVRFDPPRRGPRTPLNPGGRWVKVTDPKPKVPVIPDLNKMTKEEIGGILQQAMEMGLVNEKSELEDKAEVLLDE